MNQNEQQNGGELNPAAIALALEALESCTTGGYRDIDGDWCERRWFDEDKVKAAKSALSSSVSEPVKWVELTDEDREAAFASMPNMLDGFMKLWGWLHFAQAIEAKVREKNAHLSASPLPQEPREAELTDERIERAWWSLGTGSDGSNLAGGTTLDGWKRAVRWAERELRGAQEVKAGEVVHLSDSISALRWLLNITSEFDRKDVRTRQAARLLDEYGDGTRTNRQMLEDLWAHLTGNDAAMSTTESADSRDPQ